MPRHSSRSWRASDSDVDDDAVDDVSPPVGLDGVLATSRGRAALYSLTATRDQLSSGDDDTDDSDNEHASETADLNANPNERRGDSTRHRELVHTARLRQQGIQLDEKEGDILGEEEKLLHTEADNAETDASIDGYRAWASRSAPAAASAPSLSASKDTLTEQQIKQAKMKMLFDKKDGEKFMSFHADDPLKSRSTARRGVTDDDDELDHLSGSDPWYRSAVSCPPPSGVRVPPSSSSVHAVTRADDAPTFDVVQGRYILLKYLKPGESVLRAVKRLGACVDGDSVRRPVTKMRNQRKHPAAPSELSLAHHQHPSDAQQPAMRKQQFEQLTETAQGFLNSGHVEIYEDTYEKIQKLVDAHEAKVRQASQQAAAAATSLKRPSHDQLDDEDESEWVYKWSIDGESVHGPYGLSKMVDWQRCGFFDESVVVKEVGTSQWRKINQVDFKHQNNSHHIHSPTTTSNTASQPPLKKFKF